MTLLLSARAQRRTSTFTKSMALGFSGLALAASGILMHPAAAGATPSVEANEAINARYNTFGGTQSLLGTPIGDAVDIAGGAERDYQGGAIFYSTRTGAKIMYGAILDRYKALGGPGGELGFPTNDESDVGNGVGRFNDFTEPGGASIYWSPEWGAAVIKGQVLDAWRTSGGVTGPFGYPTTDTTAIDGVQTSKFVGPGGTEIQWSDAGGLITVPASLAATLSGFTSGAKPSEGTQPMPTPPSTSESAASGTAPVEHTSSSKWWWIPIGLVGVTALAGLIRLVTRRRPAEEDAAPVAVSPLLAPAEKEKAKVAAGVAAAKAAAAPVKAAPAPVKAAAVPVKTAPAPVKAAPPPVKAAPPPVKAASAPVKSKAPVVQPKAVEPEVKDTVPAKVMSFTNSTAPTADGHRGGTNGATATAEGPVVKYENSTAAAESTVLVTYENNAVGVNQESAADKSSRL